MSCGQNLQNIGLPALGLGLARGFRGTAPVGFQRSKLSWSGRSGTRCCVPRFVRENKASIEPWVRGGWPHIAANLLSRKQAALSVKVVTISCDWEHKGKMASVPLPKVEVTDRLLESRISSAIWCFTSHNGRMPRRELPRTPPLR